MTALITKCLHYTFIRKHIASCLVANTATTNWSTNALLKLQKKKMKTIVNNIYTFLKLVKDMC